MKDVIRSAAVLGAGTMGAQIAAHLANAGVPVRLLDLTADVARQGLKRATALKPDPFFTQEARALISIGGFDRDLPGLSSADWIVEAVVEQPEVKRALLEKVDGVRRPGSIVSSNTSGIPIGSLAEGRSEDFRRHWLGTHFFNPPRYLRLVEIIPTADTSKTVVEQMSWFADHRLGKGVVVAKDTPNFIGNRIGLFGVMGILRALESGEFTIEDIDAITGPALGRPKSATFRTMDIAGIDVMAHVARNLTERLTDAESVRAFALPTLVTKLIERGWVGEKSGQGFYKKVGNDILTLDPATLEYRPRKSARIAPLEAAQSITDTRERIRTLLLGRDKVGEFLRATLGETLIYAAAVAPEIAHSIDDVDRAMQWGFAWELGPFEIWDAVGVKELLEAMRIASPPPLVADLLSKGRTKFRDSGVPPAAPDLQILKSAKDRQKIVASNPGASLVDLGDGVLAMDLHSKLNTIGADTIGMLMNGIKEANANFAALVVGTNADDFSAGANLMLLLLEAQEGNWDELDMMVRAFQGATSALRYSTVPVVSCPAGRTLAGGCEIVISADRVQAAAETYMGLVEVGVGLIPAGGGTTEMLARAMEKLPGRQADLLPFVQAVFETLGFAKVSMSGPNARELGFLRDVDAITMNRERLMADAKALALERVREGYQPPARRSAIPVGGET